MIAVIDTAAVSPDDKTMTMRADDDGISLMCKQSVLFFMYRQMARQRPYQTAFLRPCQYKKVRLGLLAFIRFSRILRGGREGKTSFKSERSEL